MMKILRRHHISFKNAFSGVWWAIRTQPNFRVHFVMSALALALGLFLRITHIEMVIILFTILLGLTVEMINTSIESMTDLITTEWKASAKIAKDVSAGMMLLVAFGAVGVAAFIYIPYLLPLIQ
jgi:diacylglycerol kinase (ATP)